MDQLIAYAIRIHPTPHSAIRSRKILGTQNGVYHAHPKPERPSTQLTNLNPFCPNVALACRDMRTTARCAKYRCTLDESYLHCRLPMKVNVRPVYLSHN